MSVTAQVHSRGYSKMHSALIGGRGSRSSSLELYLAPRETPEHELLGMPILGRHGAGRQKGGLLGSHQL